MKKTVILMFAAFLISSCTTSTQRNSGWNTSGIEGKWLYVGSGCDSYGTCRDQKSARNITEYTSDGWRVYHGTAAFLKPARYRVSGSTIYTVLGSGTVQRSCIIYKNNDMMVTDFNCDGQNYEKFIRVSSQ